MLYDTHRFKYKERFMRVLIFVFLPLVLVAHDIWIDKTNEQYTLHYGHLHSNKEHLGHKNIPYNPKNIEQILCKNDKNIKQLSITKKYPLVVKKKCDLLYVALDSGDFTKTPYGTKKLSKKQSKMPLKSWKSYESVKRVERGQDTLLSDGLEIVLLSRPQIIGKKARLQIYYKKKPISAVVVAYADSARGMSDAEGKINIRVHHAGLQNIQATLKKPCKDKTLCDEEIYTTTLNFEVMQ